MNQLHPKFGFNPTLEICKYCKQEGAIIFYGDNINEEAPPDTITLCHGVCHSLKQVVFCELGKNQEETGYCVIFPVEEAKGITNGETGLFGVSEENLKRGMGKKYREGYEK